MSEPDIVERLNERKQLRFMGDCKCGYCHLVHIGLICEASAEIERLRAELACAPNKLLGGWREQRGRS